MRDLSERLELAQLRLVQALRQASDRYQACWAVCDEAVAYLGLEDCVLYLLDPCGNTLTQHAAFGPKQAAPGVLESVITLRLGEGIVGTAAHLRESICIDDVGCDPRYVLDDNARASELAVPIIAGERLIGVIDSEHSQQGFFSARHQQVLEAIAQLAAPYLASWIALEDIS
jgi:putative methionine-R-sulfoxide reductase with GAF domain